MIHKYDSNTDDAGNLQCYSVDQDTFLTVFGLLLVISSCFAGWKLNKAYSKALKGDKSAADVLVFPIYFTFLKITIALLILRAIMLRFIPRSSVYYGILLLGLLNGVQAGFDQSIAIFLAQRSAGIGAIQRTAVCGSLIAILHAVLGLNFFFQNNGVNQYLSTSVWYFILHDGINATFFFFMIVYMRIKNLERYSKMHYVYSCFQLCIFGTFVIGDVLGTFDIENFGCIPLVVQFIQFTFSAIIAYYTLRADSNYWRSVGMLLPNPFASEEDKLTTPLLVSDEEVRNMMDVSTTYLDFCNLKLGKLIGIGGSAKVYMGTYKNRQVAVKKMACPELTKEIAIQYAREVNLIARLKHKNIIELYGVVVILPDLALVMEYAARGSLYNILGEVSKLPYKIQLKLALGIASGVSFLHSQTPQVLHLDLKSLNVLVDHEWNPKLADFGESRVLERGTHLHTISLIKGTINWMSPEAMKKVKITEKVDIYAVGMILYEIVAGLPPFADMELGAIWIQVLDNQARPTIPEHCPQTYKKLIEECWDEDPSSRPTAEQLVSRLEELYKFQSDE